MFTRSVEGSPYKEVKVESTFEGRISSLVALIGDADACSEWAEGCENSYFYERISESEAYIYTHNNLPFPVKDRDVLAYVKWTQDSRSKAVEMLSVATTDILEPIPGRVRLTEAKTTWRFEPLGKGQVKVINQTHMDPGSSLPGWITNMLLVDTPFQTMKAFKAEALEPKYADVSVPFITEP